MDASVSETNRLYGKTFSFMALATLTSLIVGYLVIRFVPAIMLIFTNWIGALVWLGVSIGALRLVLAPRSPVFLSLVLCTVFFWPRFWLCIPLTPSLPALGPVPCSS